MALSMFCLSLTALFVRKLSHSLPPLQIASMHNMVLFAIFLPKILLHKPRVMAPWRLYIYRAILGFCSLACMFSSLKYLDVQIALSIGLLTPFFSSFFAAKALGEKMTAKRFGLLSMGAMGALVIVQPWRGAMAPDPLGVLLMCSSAILAGIVGVYIKRIAEQDGARTTVSVSAMLALIVSLLIAIVAQYTPEGFKPVGGTELVLVVISAFCSACGQYFLASALAIEKINVLISLDFLRLLFGSLLAWAWLGEEPGVWVIVGGGLVAYSAICATRLQEE